ncbi:MAG: hypothetical protein U1C74_20665 [Phenylobacterium sp.]|nr:hypothetical protein [Phenylobacterium sp.]
MAGDVGGLDPGASGPLAALVGVVAAALGAFGLWLANRMLGRAAFQTAINEGFNKLTDQIQEERDALRKELLDERVARAAKEAELYGAILNLTQTVESLKSLLRRAGIPIPDTHMPATDFVMIEGDVVVRQAPDGGAT